jgi:hypothetical protein
LLISCAESASILRKCCGSPLSNESFEILCRAEAAQRYKVAIAYAIVGWLLIQIATQVFPFFEIPNWAVRRVILVTTLGFPVALITASAFEAYTRRLETMQRQ